MNFNLIKQAGLGVILTTQFLSYSNYGLKEGKAIEFKQHEEANVWMSNHFKEGIKHLNINDHFKLKNLTMSIEKMDKINEYLENKAIENPKDKIEIEKDIDFLKKSTKNMKLKNTIVVYDQVDEEKVLGDSKFFSKKWRN